MKQTLLSEGDLLTYLPHIYFKVYMIIPNNNKILIVDFFAQRLALVAVLHLWLKSLKTTYEKNTCSNVTGI